jgi:integrase
MASIVNDPNGRKRIQFVAGDGSRKAVRLGKATMKQADKALGHIESLAAAKITGGTVDDETSRWLAEIPDTMHARLAKAGLVKPRRHGRIKLAELLEAFVKNQNVKPSTLAAYQASLNSLVETFGAETAINDIEPLQADQWRGKMKADGLAEATIAKRVKHARQIFRQARKWKMLAESPFAEVRVGSQFNKSRQRFISADDAAKVLEACPDDEWRLLFALSRFGGLRCPSEHLALKWADVDWEHNRFRVTSSKTEHHEGGGERFVPIFPELGPHLLKSFEDAEPGTEYVITGYRDATKNFRTRFERIIRRAGLTPWPRLFHNLRGTRQTELAERFPAHVVCQWIGNSERVAQNHYLQTTDAHFAKAVAEPVVASNEAAQKAAHFPAQSGAELSRNEPQAVGAGMQKSPELPGFSVPCEILRNGQMGREGLEPPTSCV